MSHLSATFMISRNMFGIKIKTPHVIRVSNAHDESGVIHSCDTNWVSHRWLNEARKKKDISWLHQKSMIFVHKIYYLRFSPYLLAVNPKFNLIFKSNIT